jgi:hypothetical protein
MGFYSKVIEKCNGFRGIGGIIKIEWRRWIKWQFKKFIRS